MHMVDLNFFIVRRNFGVLVLASWRIGSYRFVFRSGRACDQNMEGSDTSIAQLDSTKHDTELRRSLARDAADIDVRAESC